MPISTTDRIFWLRVGLGVVTGAGAEFLFGKDYESGILLAIIVYMASYYVVRRVFGPRLKPEEQNKIYTAGLGSFILLFLFFWIFLFTLGLHSLAL